MEWQVQVSTRLEAYEGVLCLGEFDRLGRECWHVHAFGWGEWLGLGKVGRW